MGLDCSRAIIDKDHAASFCRDTVAVMLDQSSELDFQIHRSRGMRVWDTILNGLAKVISTLFLEAVGGNLYLRTAVDKSVVGLTATQFRDELSVYSKAEVDSLLAGKAPPNHVHAFSVYSGSAGDPAHQHLVEGTTGIDQ